MTRAEFRERGRWVSFASTVRRRLCFGITELVNLTTTRPQTHAAAETKRNCLVYNFEPRGSVHSEVHKVVVGGQLLSEQVVV